MPRMVPHTELLVDEVGDATPGPERAPKAKRFSALLQQGLKLRAMGRTEQGRAPGRGMGAQRLHATKRGPLEPLAHSPLGHTQRFSAMRLRPSHPVQFPGTQAATCVPTRGRFRIWCAHAVEHSTSRPTSIRSLCADQ